MSTSVEERRAQSRARTRRWRQRHPNYSHNFYMQNKERISKRNAAWEKANRPLRSARVLARYYALPKEQRDQWAKTHQDRVRSYNAKYDAAHREERRLKALKRWQTFASAEPQVVRARRRQQYEMTKERSKALARIWKQNNSERAKANRVSWVLQHPGILATYGSRRRALKIGNGGAHTAEEWREKCELLGNVCIYCGEANRLERDHKVPLSRGGSDDIANIVPACRSCNARKHGRTAREFLALRNVA